MLIGGLLPVALQGVALLDRAGGGPGNKPRVQTMSISQVNIEIEPEMILLFFNFNLGEVDIELQNTNGITVLSETINTSVCDQASFGILAGVYLLTVTTTNGVELTHVYISIPE